MPTGKKRCERGHPMEPTWERCPRCERTIPPTRTQESLPDPVLVAPAGKIDSADRIEKKESVVDNDVIRLGKTRLILKVLPTGAFED